MDISGITSNMQVPNPVNFSSSISNPGRITENLVNQNPGKTFDTFLNAMLDMYNETNESIKASQQFQLDVATGISDDIVGLTLAIEKANSTLNFTVQVTNRLLESYREIMRMQV